MDQPGGRFVWRAPQWILVLCGPIVWLAPVGLWIPVAVAGLIALALHRKTLVGWTLKANPPLIGLLLLAVVSALWAVQPDFSLRRGGTLILEVLAGCAILYHIRRSPSGALFRPFLCLLLLSAAFACLTRLDMALGGGLSAWAREPGAQVSDGVVYSRGVAFQAIATLPLTLLVIHLAPTARAKGLAVLAGTLALVLVAFHSSETTMGALVLGGIAAGVVYCVPRIVVFLPVGLVFGLLAMPWIAPKGDGAVFCATERFSTLQHRMQIWTFASDRIAEKPLLGWGLEADRFIPGGKTPVYIGNCDDRSLGYYGEALPLHPHNGPLQIWLDLGGLGAVLAALALARAIVPMAWRAVSNRLEAASLTLATVPAFIVICLGYGFWQSWLLAALWVMALCIGRRFAPLPEAASQKG